MVFSGYWSGFWTETYGSGTYQRVEPSLQIEFFLDIVLLLLPKLSLYNRHHPKPKIDLMNGQKLI